MADCIILESETDSEDGLPSVATVLKRVENRTMQKSSGLSLDDKLDAKEAKKQKLEEKKEVAKRERERKKEEREQEKKLLKVVNQAQVDSTKEIQPAQRVKQMIVQMDTALTECPDLMTALLVQLQEMNTQYRVISASPSCSVSWKRINVLRSLNKELTNVVENVQETDEQYMLIVMSGKEFLDFVLSSKLDQEGQSDGTPTLLQHVQTLLQQHPSRKIVLVVDNINTALRAQKTQRNRQFRTAVRANQTESTAAQAEMVSYIDCENFQVDLQLVTGCCVRLCSSPTQIADLIITYTKALADLPFKKDSSFSFYGDLGPGASRKALQETKDKTGLIWQHQLLQYPGVSTPIASAIASNFPSPSHLLKAYNNCTSTRDAESLLEDIQVRRGAGVIASTRRVGGSISKRVHFAMTCKKPSELLPN